MIKKHLKEDLFEYIYSNLKNELQNKGIPIRFEIQDIINRLKNDVIKLVELHKDRQKKEEDYILSIKYNN